MATGKIPKGLLSTTYVELLGTTSGTGVKSLTDDYRKYDSIMLVGFGSSSTIFPITIGSGVLISAGYTLSVRGAGSSDVYSVNFQNSTSVNIISNPNTIRIYGLKVN